MASTSSSVLFAASHPRTWIPVVTLENLSSDCSKLNHYSCFGSSSSFLGHSAKPMVRSDSKRRRNRKDYRSWPVFSNKEESENGTESDGGDDDASQEKETGPVSNNDMVRERLEQMVGRDDSSFSGIDLATLIRNKYGKSYDVQLIKKEFMGKNLLAMNVMWKYVEQRSFPLTEEEYIWRLDDVANTLKCWGAVSHVRSTLEKSKERPRIGKAVSIFIDMDESGGRANEWIYR